jgi:hypothetical protein
MTSHTIATIAPTTFKIISGSISDRTKAIIDAAAGQKRRVGRQISSRAWRAGGGLTGSVLEGG